jgi:hypothetical protein
MLFLVPFLRLPSQWQQMSIFGTYRVLENTKGNNKWKR